MFTIDSGNNIAVCAQVPAAAENLQTFDSEKDLTKRAAVAGPAPGRALEQLRRQNVG